MARYPREEFEPGTVFADLTVVKELARTGANRRFLCRCTCGKEKIAFLNNLKAGRTRSCGCTYTYGAAARASIVAQRRALALVSEEGRICHTCGEWKQWEKFPNDKRRSNGKGSNCYDCNNWRLTKLYFGIEKSDWLQLFDAQGGVCALCGEAEKREMRLSIDHDHSCCGPKRACRQCIRGLLCDLCNRMLGYAEQRGAVRERFADYLAKRPFASVPAGAAGPVLEVVADDPERLQ